jgi:hypothetical protein
MTSNREPRIEGPSAGEQTPAQLAMKLVNEGWRPYPFVVGGLCRKGTNRPATYVQGEIWQAMRDLVADESPI